MGDGLRQEWSVEQTEDWRRRARTTRERLVRQAAEAVGNSREAARWNVRDRRHVEVLVRYEEVLPRLERTAIGVSVISRGLDDHARLSGTSHQPMASMAALLESLAAAVKALVERRARRAGRDRSRWRPRQGRANAAPGVSSAASRRARIALEHDEGAATDSIEGEWLNYAALLVQVDRIVGDLSAPLPP